jgi:UDPglucose 6-dehydrogenase
VKLSVIGCGYLGAVHAVALAELGHEVVGIDLDAAKVASLQSGRPTFHEPGLPESLGSALASGRLRFSTAIEHVRGSRVHFITVGTPQRRGEGAADLTYVRAAVDALLPHLMPGDLVVGKSTVPVGTAGDLAARVTASGATLAWNPEFLREGFAIADTLAPDRLVYGVPAGEAGERARDTLDEVYSAALAAGTPRIVTDYASAELVKVAANAFLATKISFINAVAEIAEVAGADVTQVADAIGLDDRIGRKFLNAGAGFGGGCLPKDVRAFIARAEELGRGDSVGFLKEVDAVNVRRRERLVDLAASALGSSPFGRRVAVLGLSFKPDSDDVRDSPALDVAVRLHGLGVDVIATDPVAIANARTLHPQLEFAPDVAGAVRDVEVVMLITEWREYAELTPPALSPLTPARTIIDGRNVLDPAEWRQAGWTYIGLGRP